MPRAYPDPARCRRAAIAYLNGDCEFRAAVERSGASYGHMTHVVAKLRRERAATQRETAVNPDPNLRG